MIFFDMPEELVIPFSIGMTIYFIVCKFTFAPQLPWLFCLFPLWVPLLLLVILLVGMVIWDILQNIFDNWF